MRYRTGCREVSNKKCLRANRALKQTNAPWLLVPEAAARKAVHSEANLDFPTDRDGNTQDRQAGVLTHVHMQLLTLGLAS